jgi:hypothetical protein
MSLYGPLLQQLGSADSFASQLKKILAARKSARIAEGEMLAAPSMSDRAICVLIMSLPEAGGLAVTALNYSRDKKSIAVDLSNVPGKGQVNGQARDIVADQDLGSVSGQLMIDLDGLTGRTIEVK